jgi:hypothetical protein
MAMDFGLEVYQRNFSPKQLCASFQLSEAASVSLQLFDLAGNTVAHRHKKCNAGPKKMIIDVEGLAVGLYLCRFNFGSKVIYHKFHRN